MSKSGEMKHRQTGPGREVVSYAAQYPMPLSSVLIVAPFSGLIQNSCTASLAARLYPWCRDESCRRSSRAFPILPPCGMYAVPLTGSCLSVFRQLQLNY